MDCLKSVNEIVSNLELPENFTMKPLNTNFIPCLTCMKPQYGKMQAYRCRHVHDCQVHILCECEDSDHCNCHCSCRQFTSPSLTRSKIGACLHLEWVETDGSTFNLDCDLNVPTVPCGTKYDGGVGEVKKYLRCERPVNWIEEVSKLEDMRNVAAESNLGQDSWQVKFRMINRETVLPRQVRV